MNAFPPLVEIHHGLSTRGVYRPKDQEVLIAKLGLATTRLGNSDFISVAELDAALARAAGNFSPTMTFEAQLAQRDADIERLQAQMAKLESLLAAKAAKAAAKPAAPKRAGK
jgi:hypothetical protein